MPTLTRLCCEGNTLKLVVHRVPSREQPVANTVCSVRLQWAIAHYLFWFTINNSSNGHSNIRDLSIPLLTLCGKNSIADGQLEVS